MLLKKVAVVLLGSEQCDNDWILPYMSSRGGKVNAVFLAVSYTHLDVYKRQFLDDSGVIRVGGRLQHSQLSYDSKHPIVLHPSAHVTRLIIEREHIRLLHAGAQLAHHSLRQRWWIVNARLVIRSIIRKCLKCIRFSATQQVQRLGILPSPRAVSYTHLDVYKRQH